MNYNHPADPSSLVTWVESHDTYCNEGKSADLNDWQIRMAYSLITARKNGTPLFYSRPDGSSGKNNRWGNNVLGAKGNDQFKDPEVVAVNKFRNAMVGESEYLRNINGSSQILAIERGKKGEVIINLGGQTSINYETTLADGKYTDQVSGREFTVSNGKISGQLDGGKVAVIYNPIPINTPFVSANPGKEDSTYSYSTDTVDVTLNSSNVTSAKYSIDGKSEVSYTNGTKISIGSDKEAGETTTLKVTGVGSNGTTVSKTYTYKEVDNSVEKAGLYFKKPSGWGSNINVYVYDEKSGSSVQTINKWPGTAMESLGNDEYFYELPESWKNTNTQVIFNDGSNQTPELSYTLGTAMKYEDGNWTELPIKQKNPLVSGNITTDLASPQYKGTAITISTEAATGGAGNYTYEFKVNDTVIKAASSDKSVTWTPSSAGTYTIKVTTTDSKGATSVKTMNYIVKEVVIDDLFASLSIDKNSPQDVGTDLTLSASAIGGSGTKQYSFVVMKDGNEVYSTAYSTNSTTTWTPNASGTYTVVVNAKDASGQTATATKSFVINDLIIKEVQVTGITTKLSGNKVIVTANAQSKSNSNLLYKFYVHEGINGWKSLSDFTSSNTAIWTPSTLGKSIIWVEARDNNGNKDIKFVNYSIIGGVTE